MTPPTARSHDPDRKQRSNRKTVTQRHISGSVLGSKCSTRHLCKNERGGSAHSMFKILILFSMLLFLFFKLMKIFIETFI